MHLLKNILPLLLFLSASVINAQESTNKFPGSPNFSSVSDSYTDYYFLSFHEQQTDPPSRIKLQKASQPIFVNSERPLVDGTLWRENSDIDYLRLSSMAGLMLTVNIVALKYQMDIWYTEETTVFHSLDSRLSLNRSRTTTYILDEPFPILPGSVDGRTRISTVRASVEGVLRGADTVVAARLALGIGLDAMSSTLHADTRIPDSQFVTGLGQVQGIARLAGGSDQIVARADYQLASQRLTSSEQFPVGGMASVRGYRENTLIRDEGVAARASSAGRSRACRRRGSATGPPTGRCSSPCSPMPAAAATRAGAGTRSQSVGGGLRWSAGGGLAG